MNRNVMLVKDPNEFFWKHQQQRGCPSFHGVFLFVPLKTPWLFKNCMKTGLHSAAAAAAKGAPSGELWPVP